MNTKVILAALMLTAATATVCEAGSTLSIRLVKASKTKKGGVDKTLKDVSALLKTLSFNTYRLVASGKRPLPADGSAVELGDYAVKCLGKKLKLHISVMKEKKELLKTDVNLRAGKPLVVGGLPSGDDKLLLVFLVSD